jgi:hypothetical protein
MMTEATLGKRVCTFKEADVTRALKAAKKAGVDVQVEIDLERKRMRITPVKAGDVLDRNEWDDELNGAGQTEIR